ncbi:GTP-binding protein, partial [bacterium]
MKDFAGDKIRNVGLVGHGGVGKTSLAEALLFSMGESNRIGKIDDGSTISDYHPDEIERKISISSSMLHGEWKEWKINILDTPGYSDFIGDTKGALSVTDMAVVVLSAIEGVEVGTEQVIEFADEYEIPRLFFINRLDNEHANFEKALKSVQDQYGNGVVAFQIPINQGEGFNKVIDLINMKLITFSSDSSGKGTVSDIPDEHKAKAEELRNKIVESAAESDDALMEAYFDAGELTEEQLLQGIRKGLLSRSMLPVLCGSADKNMGTHQLLEVIGQFGPSTLDFEKITGTEPGSDNAVERNISEKDPLSSLVFKTVSEAHV